MLQVWGASIWRGLSLEFYGTDISSGGGGVVRKVWCIKTLPLPPKINDMKNII